MPAPPAHVVLPGVLVVDIVVAVEPLLKREALKLMLDRMRPYCQGQRRSGRVSACSCIPYGIVQTWVLLIKQQLPWPSPRTSSKIIYSLASPWVSHPRPHSVCRDLPFRLDALPVRTSSDLSVWNSFLDCTRTMWRHKVFGSHLATRDLLVRALEAATILTTMGSSFQRSL